MLSRLLSGLGIGTAVASLYVGGGSDGWRCVDAISCVGTIQKCLQCSHKAPKGKQPLRVWVKTDRNRQIKSPNLTIEGKRAGLTPQSVCKGYTKHVGGGTQMSASLYVMIREDNV